MRKPFVALSILLVVAFVLGACQTKPPEPTQPAPTQAAAAEPTATTPAEATAAPEATEPSKSSLHEAPMLAELVESGQLPPLQERLPLTPAIVRPLKETGKYGGELRFGFVGNNPGWGGVWYLDGWEMPVIWRADFSGIEPNIVESWEASPDVKEYTWHLRQGMKWSDGQPFTADDILFYIDDILKDPDISPNGPIADWLPASSAQGFRVEKLDDFTVKFVFPEPYGLFMYNCATWSGRNICHYPKHYLQQFHKKYNANVDELLKNEEGVQDWISLFNKYATGINTDLQDYNNLPERPTLFPYVVKQPLGTGTEAIYERNPYYWKVDDQGNQLPYIDRIVAKSYQDDQSRTFAMLNGDLDVVKDPGDDNRPLYYDAMDQGKPIQINKVLNDGANSTSIHFNQTLADPVKAEVFANKDFRIGVSYSINRQEVIEVINDGQGVPSQVCPQPSSPLYYEPCNEQYTEYDVNKANEYLDKVLPKKDAEGFRLDKNGKRFSFVLLIVNDWSWAPKQVKLGEMLVNYWQAVGLDVKLNPLPDAQMGQVRLKNEIEAFVATGEGGAGLTAILDSRYFVPMEFFGVFGNGWTLWRLKPPEATGEVEPPQWAKDARAKYEEVLKQPTQEQQIAKMKEVVKEATERFYVIGVSQGGEGYQPFHKRLGNIPDEWYGGWIEGVLKLMYPEQWYVKE